MEKLTVLEYMDLSDEEQAALPDDRVPERVVRKSGEPDMLLVDGRLQELDLCDSDALIPEDERYPWFRHADGTLGDRIFPDSTEEHLADLADPAMQFVLGPLAGQRFGLFALGSMHLIQGSSGAGKTTFGLMMLRAQKAEEMFFGREGMGLEYLVVWQDRGPHELTRQLDNMRMRANPPRYVIPTIAQMNMLPDRALSEILIAENKVSFANRPRVVFIEGLDLWMPDIKDMKNLSTIASNLREVALQRQISIIGSVGMPKMKPKEGYQIPRDRAIGSSAWARKADTVVDITVDPQTGLRHVLLLSRTDAEQKLILGFKGGLLEEHTPACGFVGTLEGDQVPSIREIKEKYKVGNGRARIIQEELAAQATEGTA